MNRLKPSFFIIGERKCGTSSLFRYLCSHPQVLPGKLKESNFFSHSSRYIERHIEEYYSLFPSLDEKEVINRWPELDQKGKVYYSDVVFPIDPGVAYITGEASANVFSTVNARKLKKHLPEVKLILILRDPVERAFSHHAMHMRYKKEGRKHFQWVTRISTSFRWERAVMGLGFDGPYISPGRYAHYLKRWISVFGLRNIFVMELNELDQTSSANEALNRLSEFLEIEPYDFSPILKERFNASGSSITDKEVAQKLRDYYRPFNQELEQILQKKFSWV